MEIPSLDTADRFYNQETVLHLVKFDNRKLADLSREISKLFRSLGDQKELSVWPSIIITLKKVRFELATLPLSPKQIITDRLMLQLNNALPVCHDSFPENIEQLSFIIEMLTDFQKQENQFISWIQTECMQNNNGEICLCLLFSKHVQLVEHLINSDKYLSNLNLKVTSPKGLKSYTFYDRIIFCGSVNLFSENQFRNFEHVWRAPRASDLYFLSFNWIRDDFEPKPTFDVKPNKVPVRIQKERVGATCADHGKKIQKNEKIQVDIRDIDFSPVELVPRGLIATNAGYYEAICESRLLMLEDETFIYKEVESFSRIVEFTPQAEIKKIPTNKLERGMPLVVRTEGSGDSIAAVADMLFGELADEIRSKQEKWKIAFRRKLFTFSTLHEVAIVLTSLGAPTANETNVRNWQRNDTIKPKNENDFKAIMVFSELADMSEEYWKNARQIDLMHKKAGRKISKLLLGRINDTSRTDLEKYGRIDVELSGLSGKVSLIRIEAILPEIYKIPSSQLNKVLHY